MMVVTLIQKNHKRLMVIISQMILRILRKTEMGKIKEKMMILRRANSLMGLIAVRRLKMKIKIRLYKIYGIQITSQLKSFL